MSQYVDGFVLPVPNDNLEAYREMAADAGRHWIDHGALQYVECVGEDLHPEVGDETITAFPDLTGVGADESVIFAFIIFESREHRDEVNAAVMAAMESIDGTEEVEMPFDVARMAYGGFDTLVAYQAEQSDEASIGTTS